MLVWFWPEGVVDRERHRREHAQGGEHDHVRFELAAVVGVSRRWGGWR